MAELASAYIQLIPSFEGMAKAITSEMNNQGQAGGKGFGDSFSKMFNKDIGSELKSKFESTFGQLGDKLPGLLKLTGVASSIAMVTKELFDLSSETAAYGDNIDKMSQRLGISNATFQELDFVLSQNGSNINSFSTGMKTLLKNMDGVNEGNETAISNFQKLGVSVLDSSGNMRSQEEVMKDTIIAFQNMENGSEKARLAQELFGRQGQEIMPLLNQEAGNFEELTQKAHDYGLVMSDDAVGASADFVDAQDLMSRTWDSLKNVIGVTFMPAFTGAMNLIAQGLAFVRPLFDAFGAAITFVFDLFKDIGTEAFGSFTQVLEGDSSGWMDIFNTLKTTVSTIASVFMTVFNGVIKPILIGFAQTMGMIVGIVVSVAGSIMAPIVRIETFFVRSFGNIKKTVSSVVNWLKSAFSFKITLPKIKMPTFKISPSGWKIGDLLKGTIPKLSIAWKKTAMSEGEVLTRPTIFGMQNGQLLGAGEAGNEVVVGQQSLRKMIEDASSKSEYSYSGWLYSIDRKLNTLIEVMKQRQNFYINGKAAAYAMAEDINSAVNDLTKFEEMLRGIK